MQFCWKYTLDYVAACVNVVAWNTGWISFDESWLYVFLLQNIICGRLFPARKSLNPFCRVGLFLCGASSELRELRMTAMSFSLHSFYTSFSDSEREQLPDRTFHNFRASKPVDRWTLCRSETYIDGLWGSEEIVRCHVGYVADERKHGRKKKRVSVLLTKGSRPLLLPSKPSKLLNCLTQHLLILTAPNSVSFYDFYVV